MNIEQFNQVVFLATEAYKAKYKSEDAQSFALATARATGIALNDPALTHASSGLSETLLRVKNEALEAIRREEEVFSEYNTFIRELAEHDIIEQAFNSANKITNERIDELFDGEVESVGTYAVTYFQENFITNLNKALKTNFASTVLTRGFFSKNQSENTPAAIEEKQSSLSTQQITEIRNLISKLNKEINSFWPYPHKDRKAKKVEGLEALIENSLTMDAISAVNKVEINFPEIRLGSISSRTADLLDSIKSNGVVASKS
ncbi:hypothetical protein [Legionella clemsonensis]|uniref:Uncharacterized protein n=1 Tax=Legionella clemsonensis TaxID=1867846 RepID=A0A222P3W2_9GAMM|nr:hypothetical protein [Legionella clemsonensis]ASQ46522.1 hypothetical protein clem_09865 [Legionella clemsonensis]